MVDYDHCSYCGACVAVCPPDCIILHDATLLIDPDSLHPLPPLHSRLSDRRADLAGGSGMIRESYDVVVIGAGPAGSIAARTCAQAGLRVLLAEKRQEIGSPVRCAEAVGKETVAEFIPLDSKWIAAEVDHFQSNQSAGRHHVTCRRWKHTLVLERKIFDRELAHSAAQAGAEVVVKARATGFIRNGAGLKA